MDFIFLKWNGHLVSSSFSNKSHRKYNKFSLSFLDYIKFQVDNHEPWKATGPFGGHYTNSPNKMAPFDQEFYFLINLAVGGTNGYFSDDMTYTQGKPWKNSDGRRVGQTKFWKSRQWMSYIKNPKQSSLHVDYIKVWAI